MTEEPADKPLTILIACDTYPPHLNGAAQFGFRLAQGMHGRGHNVHVLAPSPESGPAHSETDGPWTVHRLVQRGVVDSPEV